LAEGRFAESKGSSEQANYQLTLLLSIIKSQEGLIENKSKLGRKTVLSSQHRKSYPRELLG
jgi:hypothetical protein